MSKCYYCGNDGGRLFKSSSTGYLWCTKCLQAFALSDITDETLFCNQSETSLKAQATNSPARVTNPKTSTSMQASAAPLSHTIGEEHD